MFIDTHAHLNFKAFNSDYASAILRAEKEGVKKFILPASNLETSQKAVQIAKENKNVFAAVGLHPIHVKDENFDELLEEYKKLAENKKVVAIGETGMDYYYDRGTSELQKEVLEKHIKLAKFVNKPLIIHCRDAYEDLLSVLISENNLPKAVMHCYLGTWDYAKILLEMGFYFSFTGIITFTKDQNVLKAVENIPLDRMMIETDSPWLTPESHRGERNEPAFVIEVAKKIAELKKIPLSEVETQTTKNAEEFFKI
ncbi:TPA: TatD family deoxyribonuclease [Candidatus Berkelbacteria bacterium]|uniref:Hydrolase, TatD family n=1 Tax=Berkelbacteria bacterium GW2011_GWE1_39_12 TaxID=1618337 RepID=A0A0G4B2F9_9BACT|nr:MAG: hydrolase, TatD family [Berkelbacteria bacterium GW2011_GWE1_39_12]HBO60561.1 TatD family deoxyribonuclease [Candidatus Berkelbacteria bacterium]